MKFEKFIEIVILKSSLIDVCLLNLLVSFRCLVPSSNIVSDAEMYFLVRGKF